MLSGIYQITCVRNGKIYVGSSKHIAKRWAQHRADLRKGKSSCIHLQNCWNKHGEHCFRFSILEKCSADDLEDREQFYVDTLQPKLNCITDIRRRWGPGVFEKRAATLRALAAKITHCPKGHPYDEANTYRGKSGKRICRACNGERVSRIYAAETPEQREERRRRVSEYVDRERDTLREKQRAYTAATREQKRAYDLAHRAEGYTRRKIYRATESPERRAERLSLKRASYHRNKG